MLHCGDDPGNSQRWAWCRAVAVGIAYVQSGYGFDDEGCHGHGDLMVV